MLRTQSFSGRKSLRAGIALALLSCFLPAAPAVAQLCSVDISTSPASPVPAGQAVSVNATLISSGGPILTAMQTRNAPIGGGGSASVTYDGALICSSFSDSCFTSIDPGAAGFHNLGWSCSDNNGSNSGSQSLQVTSSGPGGTADIFPKFFILSLVYAPPGNQSSAGFSDTTSLGANVSITDTFIAGTTVTFSNQPDPLANGILAGISGGATFGFTLASGLTQSLSDTVSSTSGSQVLSSFDFVNHYQDRFFLWLNPEFVVTQTGPNTGTFRVTTPLGPDGHPEQMDILDFSVGDLQNPGQIPLTKLQSRVVDGAVLPGLSSLCANRLPDNQCTVTNACGCTPADFTTILKQDPLVFPITGPAGQIIGANDPPSGVDTTRYVRINQADPFLDGGSPVRNTFSLSDAFTSAIAASESISVSESAFIQKDSLFGLTFRNENTFTFTETASFGVSFSVSHSATVTLGSSTSNCDENTDVWEDILFHTFLLVPAGPSPAACGTQDGDFALSSSPSIESVPVGGLASFGVYALGMFGFTGTENLSVAGVPPGATATFTPSSLTGTGASELRIQTTALTPNNDYPLTVTGSSQGLTRRTNLTLRVNDFSVAVSPALQVVTPGGTTTYSVSITSLTQFDSNITLSVSGLPAGVTAAFSPCNASPCTIGGPVSGFAGSTLTISVSGAAQPGNSALTISATGQGVTHNATATLGVVDFSLLTTPSTQTVIAGGTATYTVSAAALNGFSGSIVLSVTAGLPPGAVANFNPPSINGSGSSTLSIMTGASTPGANYQLTITGTSGTDTHSITVVLGVQNFALSVTPASQSVSPGGCAGYSVTVTAQNGFSGPITLTLNGSPIGASFSFSPASIIGGGSSTLTVCTSTSTPASVYPLTITASSGSLSHSATVTLAVGVGYSLASSPSSQTVPAGAGTTYTVTIAPTGGFSGSVALSVSGLPAGAAGTFNPASVTVSGSASVTSTLTVTTTGSTPAGTFPLTIAGSGGGLTATTPVTLIVTVPVGDFSITASPHLKTVTAGNSATYLISTTALNGFNGNIALTVSGLPLDADGSPSPAVVGPNGSSSLTVFTGSTTGTFTITITGTSGGLTRSTSVVLSITAPNPCGNRPHCILPL